MSYCPHDHTTRTVGAPVTVAGWVVAVAGAAAVILLLHIVGATLERSRLRTANALLIILIHEPDRTHHTLALAEHLRIPSAQVRTTLAQLAAAGAAVRAPLDCDADGACELWRLARHVTVERRQ